MASSSYHLAHKQNPRNWIFKLCFIQRASQQFEKAVDLYLKSHSISSLTNSSYRKEKQRQSAIPELNLALLVRWLFLSLRFLVLVTFLCCVISLCRWARLCFSLIPISLCSRGGSTHTQGCWDLFSYRATVWMTSRLEVNSETKH